MTRETPTDIQTKTRYHHGDLKEALLDAVEQLIIEKGAENFSLADACRLAGVSTAAPYRHFEDREDILSQVLARAFQQFRQRAEESISEKGLGTLDTMVELSKAYIAFAIEQQSLFRLMFGQKPELKSRPMVQESGRECFGLLVKQVEAYCNSNGICNDTTAAAIRVWTFVHGAASLLIDDDYETVAPHVDFDYICDMIENSFPTILENNAGQSS